MLDQLGGSSAVAYYASYLFTEAGKTWNYFYITSGTIYFLNNYEHYNSLVYIGFSSSIGTTTMAIIQVDDAENTTSKPHSPRALQTAPAQ